MDRSDVGIFSTNNEYRCCFNGENLTCNLWARDDVAVPPSLLSIEPAVSIAGASYPSLSSPTFACLLLPVVSPSSSPQGPRGTNSRANSSHQQTTDHGTCGAKSLTPPRPTSADAIRTHPLDLEQLRAAVVRRGRAIGELREAQRTNPEFNVRTQQETAVAV